MYILLYITIAVLRVNTGETIVLYDSNTFISPRISHQYYIVQFYYSLRGLYTEIFKFLDDFSWHFPP